MQEFFKKEGGAHGRWDVYNDFIHIFVNILDGGRISTKSRGVSGYDDDVAQIKVLLHESESSATSVPMTKWQRLRVSCGRYTQRDSTREAHHLDYLGD